MMIKIKWNICSNCGKETGLSMKGMNTNYKYLIIVFVLNTVLHHVGMSWIAKQNIWNVICTCFT